RSAGSTRTRACENRKDGAPAKESLLNAQLSAMVGWATPKNEACTGLYRQNGRFLAAPAPRNDTFQFSERFLGAFGGDRFARQTQTDSGHEVQAVGRVAKH